MCHFLILLSLASATASILVPHSTANATPWTQQQCVPNMKSLSQSLGHVSGEYNFASLFTSVLTRSNGILRVPPLAVMEFIALRTSNKSVQLKQHFPCQFNIVNQYVRRHGFLQQMTCFSKKQQVHSSHMLAQLIKFPVKYSGKISDQYIKAVVCHRTEVPYSPLESV